MCAAKKPRTLRSIASILVGAVTGGAGMYMVIGLTGPRLGATVSFLQETLAITVVLTALYAPEKYSKRAFRVLPWTVRRSAKSRSPKTGKNRTGNKP